MKAKNLKKTLALCILTAVIGGGTTFAQEKKTEKEKESGDRNVMLNASNNTGPRDVNIGLPASVGGTTILENGIPTVFAYYPEYPTKAWRKDATITSVKLLNLGQTAILGSEVGFSVSSFNNLGTENFQGSGSVNLNHFGLHRSDINISGPLNNSGLKFSVGAYGSFDPGTFKAIGMPKYYGDDARLYKIALTQDYKLSGTGKGSISGFYKYAQIDGMGSKYSPFIYGKDGKVTEIDGFRIGLDSYIERSGRNTLRDAFTGEMVERDIVKDYGSQSHSVDLISKNTLSSGLNINIIFRYRNSETGQYGLSMSGVDLIKGSDVFTYADNPSKVYTKSDVQKVRVMASRKTPLRTYMGRIEIGRESGNHKWSVGFDQWNFNSDKFVTESMQYYQEVAPNPYKLVRNGGAADFDINRNLEYYDGGSNKTALFFLDKWKVSDIFTLDMGARLQYFNLRGEYINIKDRLPNGMTNVSTAPKTAIKHDWFTKALMLNGELKLTRQFGVLGEVVYNEDGAQLSKYSSGNDPDLKMSKIPSAGVGVFFNHDLFSLVSKATYINRDQYRTATNFAHPTNSSMPDARVVAKYDVQTIGWTTDILATPFKGFKLHFLFTYQEPKYKNFAGSAKFDDGAVVDYDYGGKIVTGIPKVLIEIDPSYTWKNLRLSASARYFSKQYFNKSNTLGLQGRWETFAGVNYKINKFFDVSGTLVNLLNQRGASGSMPDADLILTNEEAQKKVGRIMSGSYIRPFTAEFGVKYKF